MHGAEGLAPWWCVTGGTATSVRTGPCSNPELLKLTSHSQKVPDTTAAGAGATCLAVLPWLRMELSPASFSQAQAEGLEVLSVIGRESYLVT